MFRSASCVTRRGKEQRIGELLAELSPVNLYASHAYVVLTGGANRPAPFTCYWSGVLVSA